MRVFLERVVCQELSTLLRRSRSGVVLMSTVTDGALTDAIQLGNGICVTFPAHGVSGGEAEGLHQVWRVLDWIRGIVQCFATYPGQTPVVERFLGIVPIPQRVTVQLDSLDMTARLGWVRVYPIGDYPGSFRVAHQSKRGRRTERRSVLDGCLQVVDALLHVRVERGGTATVDQSGKVGSYFAKVGSCVGDILKRVGCGNIQLLSLRLEVLPRTLHYLASSNIRGAGAFAEAVQSK